MADPEVIDAQSTALARPEPKEFLGVLNRAIEAKAPIETMERLYALFEKQQDREAEKLFNEAFAECQADLPVVLNDRFNSQTSSSYATLDAINEAIMPIVAGHGFGVAFWEAEAKAPGNVRIECRLSHKAGHSITRGIEGPLDGAGLRGNTNKIGIQSLGSTLTYLRRYLFTQLFNVSTDGDVDGNAAAKPKTKIPTITAEQADVLVAEIKATDSDMAKLLEHYEIGDIRELPALRLGEVNKALAAKRKKMNPEPTDASAEGILP